MDAERVFSSESLRLVRYHVLIFMRRTTHHCVVKKSGPTVKVTTHTLKTYIPSKYFRHYIHGTTKVI